jgi:methylenetetrahydrofolate reductase (NADPH)
MKVTDHLERTAGRPLVSFEIIPPLRGGNLLNLLELIEDLVEHRPPFIDITSHAAQVIYEETAEGVRRKVKRKRPGTLGVCALIQNKYNIDAVPHVLCRGFTREETEDFLIELKYLGIENVLAVRGDDNAYEKPLQFGRSANRYAVELVQQIADMNHGKYLEEDLLDSEPSSFCIGVGGYPEKHCEAPNLESDVSRVKAKVEAGGEYIVTQMFFCNEHYFRFVDQCRAAGITAPVIPGLKILTSASQLATIPRAFHCEIPYALSSQVEGAPPEEVMEVGVRWAARQCEELFSRGAPAVHFYVMQNAEAVSRVMKQLELD